MHTTLVINAHTLHQSLTYSFPSTRDPYSPRKLFTYSSASVCANNGEIIMWACWWVWVWLLCVCVSMCVCVSVLCTSVAESKDCYKSYLPLIPQIPRALPIACSSTSLFGEKRRVAPIAPVKWHKPEAMLLRLCVREQQRLSRRHKVTVLQCLSHRALNTLPTL